MKFKYSQTALLIYSFALVVFSGMEETTMIENFIGAALVGIFFLESSLSNNFVWRWHWSMVFILLFIAYAFASIILNPESVRRFITVVLVMILFFVVYNIITVTKSIVPVAIGLTLGLFYTFIIDYDQIMQSIDGVSNDRLSGLVGNPNNYSFYLFGTSLLLLLPIIGKYQINPVVRYLIYACIFIFSVLILTTTGSRKGIILLAFIFITTFFLMSKGEHAFVKIQYIMIFSLLGIFLYNLFSESSFFTRMENIFIYTSGGEVDEGSLETRDNMISTALSMWADKPFIGWGLDSFRVHSGYGTYSHNNYTELLFGQGLIGLSLYYGFFISLLYSCSKLLKRFKYTDSYKIIGWAIISIFVLLLWDFAAVSYYDKKYWLMVGITLAVLVNTEDHL